MTGDDKGKGIAHCYTNIVNGQWTPLAVPVPRGNLWYEYFHGYWKLTVAMVFGSLIAGSTPLGGGVVAFPVVVLVIGLTPDQGRDFSVCIQSVGMNAAAFLLMTVKPHLLDFKFITIFTVVGTAGVLTGLAWQIQPYYINLLYTSLVLEFSFVYFYTNVLAPRKSNAKCSVAAPMPSSRVVWGVHVLMILFAFAGGIVTANVGSGSDIMLYAFGIYVWNSAFTETSMAMPENMLTASSVVVMGLLSIVTAVTRQATVGVSMNVWYALGACSWLVCWVATRLVAAHACATDEPACLFLRHGCHPVLRLRDHQDQDGHATRRWQAPLLVRDVGHRRVPHMRDPRPLCRASQDSIEASPRSGQPGRYLGTHLPQPNRARRQDVPGVKMYRQQS